VTLVAALDQNRSDLGLKEVDLGVLPQPVATPEHPKNNAIPQAEGGTKTLETVDACVQQGTLGEIDGIGEVGG
jgi:hypothetical protein